MWVLCNETAYFRSEEETQEISVEAGKVYQVTGTEVDPVRVVNGEEIPLHKGDWYTFLETGTALHWGGRFTIVDEDSEEVMNHVRGFLKELEETVVE